MATQTFSGVLRVPCQRLNHPFQISRSATVQRNRTEPNLAPLAWQRFYGLNSGLQQVERMLVRELSNKLFRITLSSTICAYVPLNLQLNTCYHVDTYQYVMATDNVLKLNIHRSDLPCHHWELFLRTHYHIPLSHRSLWSLTAHRSILSA